MKTVASAWVVLVACLGAVACTESGKGFSRILVPCDDPAPLSWTPASPVATYTVVLPAGVDVAAEAARLASACGFTVSRVYESIPEFDAQLNALELGCVRCDPVVISVSPEVVAFPL